MLDVTRILNKLRGLPTLEGELRGLTPRQAERRLRADGMSQRQAKAYIAELRARTNST
jgi:hypothetical protein